MIAIPQKVYLVGAGPGDPDLLTRKAWRILQSADVVLHDDLVSEDILRTLPATAQIVSVGKRCGTKGISQTEINALMISLAREGKIVVRLKNGDPMLFGRAGEEMDSLRQAKVDFAVVPGVTAALGAAAAAEISLTDRRHAARVVFVTAHRKGSTGLNSEHDVAANTTYVIYMPGNRYEALGKELRNAGIGAEIPCVVLSRATTKDQMIYRTSVGKLSECPATISPSLLIVGAVAGLATDKRFGEDKLSSNVSDEVLSLALQHPFYDSYGGSGVE